MCINEDGTSEKHEICTACLRGIKQDNTSIMLPRQVRFYCEEEVDSKRRKKNPIFCKHCGMSCRSKICHDRHFNDCKNSYQCKKCRYVIR